MQPLASPLCWHPFMVVDEGQPPTAKRGFLHGGEDKPPSSLSVDEARLAVRITSCLSQNSWYPRTSLSCTYDIKY